MRKYDGEILYVRDFILGLDKSTSVLYTRRFIGKTLQDVYDGYVKEYNDRHRQTRMFSFDEFKNQFYTLTGYTSRRKYDKGGQVRIICVKD